VANPQSAKSEKILQRVDEREILLTQNQYDQVITGRLIAGAKEKLDAKLTSTKSKRDFAFNNLVKALKEDTSANSRDSIIYLLDNEVLVMAKYALVDEYLSATDTINAFASYIDINNSFELNNNEYAEWQNYLDWLNYRVIQLQEGNSHMNPDSLQKIALYNIYNDSKGSLKALVKNVLINADTLTYHEPYLSIDTTRKAAKTVIRPIEDNKNNNHFSVFPNPSSDYFVIDFSEIKTLDEKISIQVNNMEGKIVDRCRVNSNIGNKIIDTRTWKPGVYTISLSTSDKIYKSGKVTIYH
jgi:hypothetical protein